MSVRHAILGLLAQHPRHGYELRAAFSAVIGGDENWDVKPAQIYSTLNRLEEAGLVHQQAIEQNGGPEKRIYGLTDAGRQTLRDRFALGIAPEHQRDDFFVKLMTASSLAPLTRGASSRFSVPALSGTARRHHSARNLQSLRQNRPYLLLDKSIMHIEATVRLHIAEMRLGEIKRQPLPEPEVKPRGRPRKNRRKVEG